MLRRAASGHIEAIQLSKFAAALRIALAVISGWPEAPSSPLHGCGAPLAGAAADGAGVVSPPFGPLKMLPRKSSAPPPEDCAKASPHQTSAAATITAVRLVVDCPDRRLIFHPQGPERTRFEDAWSRFPIA